MGSLRPTTRWLLASLFAVVVASVFAVVVVLPLWSEHRGCQETPFTTNLVADVLQRTGILTFHSETCQDRWIVIEVFPFLRKGYFVDVGSADGVQDSNTKVLEDLGWEGICIDPFPRNMGSRRCTLFTNPVDSASGRRVRFRSAGNIGGIEDHLGRVKDATRDAPVVELETRTLTDLLVQAKAPRFIQYMSMDIEGAELEALEGLDFSRYRIGALTIEHNFEEPKRSRIRALLQSKGYRWERSVEQDDYYLNAAGPG